MIHAFIENELKSSDQSDLRIEQRWGIRQKKKKKDNLTSLRILLAKCIIIVLRKGFAEKSLKK